MSYNYIKNIGQIDVFFTQYLALQGTFTVLVAEVKNIVQKWWDKTYLTAYLPTLKNNHMIFLILILIAVIKLVMYSIANFL